MQSSWRKTKNTYITSPNIGPKKKKRTIILKFILRKEVVRYEKTHRLRIIPSFILAILYVQFPNTVTLIKV